MKLYAEKLRGKGREVKYVTNKDAKPLETSFKELSSEGKSILFYYDPVDHKLREKLQNLSDEFDV